MVNLKKLETSLTKHGAHKVSTLIELYPSQEILRNISGSIPGINIEIVQTQKNLSAYPHGKVPLLWDEVRKLGRESINDLVFIAIVFSHHRLIDLMIKNTTGEKIGIVNRTDFTDEKEYTNFAHIIEQLGFAINQTYSRTEYDLSRIFSKFELIPLIIELLKLKLESAGWKKDSKLIEECLKLKFNRVFGISEKYFKNWLEKGITEEIIEKEVIFDDEPIVKQFEFSNGHIEKTEGEVIIKKTSAKLKSTLIHNKIQNELYKYFVSKYSASKVGTEVNTGFDTNIDIVVETDGYNFYEIKTQNSLRACIREALPQLIEYSYWPDREIAKKLIIISPNKITNQAKKYLEHLRNKFNIPIYYQQFDYENSVLGDLF